MLLIAGLVLPPLMNISRYKRRIASSLSASLGRPVELGNVRLVLLPRPAFSIANLVVDDLPEFGAEPLLQCGSVTASLRLLSLWRGRLEVSRISLDEPSLNLQRESRGRWNFASVLTEASHVSNAPTGQMRPGRSLRFPYIEATGARINFKHGDEKLPFSLLNADMAMWLENPDDWRIRFRAQPTRTDMNFSAADTGILRMDGAIKRVADPGALPLDLTAQWEKAPLGQISRMLTGEDAGWRADMDIRAHIGGTPDRLLLHATARALDFHRAEFEPAQAMQMAATCGAVYSRSERLLSDIVCTAPVGNGAFTVTGTLGTPASQLTLELSHAPAGAFLDWLRHARRGLAPNTAINGEVNGRFQMSGGTWEAARLKEGAFTGSAVVSAVRLRLPETSSPVSVPDLHLAANGGASIILSSTQRSRKLPEAARPALLLEPVLIGMGGAMPITVDGRFTSQEFALHATGGAALARLLPLARAWKILPAATAALAAAGETQLNLTVAGPWITPVSDTNTPSSLFQPSGRIALRNARLETGYLHTPLIIIAAQGTVTAQEIAWSGVEARLDTTAFEGRFRMPVNCTTPASCTRHFDLSLAALDTGSLRESLSGARGTAIVRAWLNRMGPQTALWPPLEGTVRVARLILGPLTVQNVTASLSIDKGALEIVSLDGRALGGSVHSTGDIAFSGTPDCTAHVQLTGADVRMLAALFGERWGSGGNANLEADLKLQGADAHTLSRSAVGTVHWDWTGGGWPELPDVPLASFDSWTADGNIADGVITITRSLLTSGSTAEPVSGAVTLGRQIELQTGASSATITGTLQKPLLHGEPSQE